MLAEQYFSCDSAIARSTAAAGRPRPLTMKCMWICVNTFGSVGGALGRHLDLAAAHVVAAALEDQHHVVGGAAAGAGQHRFHRPRRQVAAAAVGRAVHRQQVAAAGLGDERHAGRGQPVDRAFHRVRCFASYCSCSKKRAYTRFRVDPAQRTRDCRRRMRDRADCLLHLLSLVDSAQGRNALGFFLRAAAAAGGSRPPRMMRCRNRAPAETRKAWRHPPASRTPEAPARSRRRLPAEDPDRARLRRRASRSPLEPARSLSRAAAATRCCSSARTSSRCSASSCAAPTTRWRT